MASNHSAIFGTTTGRSSFEEHAARQLKADEQRRSALTALTPPASRATATASLDRLDDEDEKPSVKPAGTDRATSTLQAAITANTLALREVAARLRMGVFSTARDTGTQALADGQQVAAKATGSRTPTNATGAALSGSTLANLERGVFQNTPTTNTLSQTASTAERTTSTQRTDRTSEHALPSLTPITQTPPSSLPQTTRAALTPPRTSSLPDLVPLTSNERSSALPHLVQQSANRTAGQLPALDLFREPARTPSGSGTGPAVLRESARNQRANPLPNLVMAASQQGATPGVGLTGRAGAAGGRTGAETGRLVAALQANTNATTANTVAMVKSLKASVGGPGGKNPGLDLADPKEKDNSGADRFKTFEHAAKQLGSTIQSVWQQGSQGILSLVSAADPAMFSTFQASLHGLAIEVGTIFVPYVEWAARSIQDLTTWFSNLDDGTKKTIGYIGAATVGAAGLFAAFKALSPVIGLATGAVKLFGAAWAVTPLGAVTAAVGLLAAGVYTLSSAWGSAGKSARDATFAMNGAGHANIAAQQGQQKPPTVHDILQQLQKVNPTTTSQIVTAGASPQRVQQNAAVAIQQLEEQVAADRAAQIPATVGERAEADKKNAILQTKFQEMQKAYDSALATNNAFLRNTGYEPHTQLTIGNPETDALQKTIDALRVGAISEAKKQGITITPEEAMAMYTLKEGGRVTRPRFDEIQPGGAKTAVISDRIKQGESTIALLQELRKATSADTFVQNFKSPVQARYTDALSFRDSAQTQALNVGDLDAKNAEEVMKKMNDRLQGQGKTLEEIRDGINEMLKLPFMFGS